MFTHPLIKTAYLGVIIAAVISLAGCADIQGMFKTTSKPVVKTVKTQKYDASAFVEHLSVARITLENGGSLSDIADNSKVIESYTKQKKASSGSMKLVVLEYTANGKAQRAIAPLNENKNLNALSNVLTPLGTASYKLKDVYVRGVSVSPGLPLKISGQDSAAVKQAIDTRHEAIINSAHKVSALEDARLQLKLLRFFTSTQQRDAAYICADNTKRLLSSLPQQGTEGDKINQLARELEAAEGELRQKMPY